MEGICFTDSSIDPSENHEDFSSIMPSVTFILEATDGLFVDTLINGEINYGGIDLTDPYIPKIDNKKITGLNKNSYNLYTIIGDENKKMLISLIENTNKIFTTNQKKSQLNTHDILQIYDIGGHFLCDIPSSGNIVETVHLQIKHPGCYIVRNGNHAINVFIH